MTLTATAEQAQPMTRRERRELERRAAEAAAQLQVAEPVFMTRRERRLAEAAALAADAPAAVDAAVEAAIVAAAPVKAELVAEHAAAQHAAAPSAGLGKFVVAAAAPVAEQAIPAAFAQPEFAPAEDVVRLGSTRAVRPVVPGAAGKRARNVAGTVALGLAASAGVAAWLPAATGAANASADTSADAPAGQVLTVAASTSAHAQTISRTDTVRVTTMGSATAANLLTPMAINDAKAYTNDLTAAVQYPFPTGVPITDPFGMRTHPVYGATMMHNGVDLTPGAGTPIGAMAQGRVTTVDMGANSGYGVHVIVEHVIDGQRVTTLYSHLEAEATMPVKVGDIVNVGDVVGHVGNTGVSTGPHLHFEVRIGTDTGYVDPMAFIAAHNNAATQVTPVVAAVQA